MRVNWYYIKMLVLLLLTGGLFAFASARNNSRLIEGVAIKFDDESTPFVTREVVNKLLIQSNDKLTGKPKEKLALNEMERRLELNPIIKDAEVYISLKGELGVSVTQKKPIARVSGTTSFYIDQMGEVMPLSDHFTARVPLVTGASQKHAEEIHKLITFIKEDTFLEKHIVGVHRNTTGTYVLTPRMLDYKIVLGDTNQLHLKFSNYKVFYQKASKDKSLDAYKLINLKYRNQVVCEKNS